MVSLILTQLTFWLCAALFVRLFTYTRDGAQFKRLISCVAVVTMGSAGAAMIYILQGELHVPAECWPLVVQLAVFVAGVIRSGGNLAGVMRPEAEASWPRVERRKADHGPRPAQK